MSEPVIGYKTIINSLNVTANAMDVGFPVVSLANSLTFDRWRAPAGAVPTVYVDAGAMVPCDYAGIASHTLGDGLVTVRVYSCTGPLGVGAVLRATKLMATNAPVIIPFASVSSRYWMITNTAALAPYGTVDIGVLFLGERLTFERCIMGGHAPAGLNRRTDFYDNDSEDGQFLGRSIIRRGFQTDVSFKMMTAAWTRNEFQGFVKAARLSPYFFQWNPSLYPDEVVFGRTAEDIGAEYTGDRDRMMAAWKIRGLGYDD